MEESAVLASLRVGDRGLHGHSLLRRYHQSRSVLLESIRSAGRDGILRTDQHTQIHLPLAQSHGYRRHPHRSLRCVPYAWKNLDCLCGACGLPSLLISPLCLVIPISFVPIASIVNYFVAISYIGIAFPLTRVSGLHILESVVAQVGLLVFGRRREECSRMRRRGRRRRSVGYGTWYILLEGRTSRSAPSVSTGIITKNLLGSNFIFATGAGGWDPAARPAP